MVTIKITYPGAYQNYISKDRFLKVSIFKRPIIQNVKNKYRKYHEWNTIINLHRKLLEQNAVYMKKQAAKKKKGIYITFPFVIKKNIR